MTNFSVFHWLILGLILWVVVAAVKGSASGMVKGNARFCTTCGHEGPTKTRTKGSLLIEIILWLCFLVPGLIYSIWRISSRQPVCTSCGATTLVPPDSPMAVAQKKALQKG